MTDTDENRSVVIVPAERRDVTPFDLLGRAINSGASIEMLRELMMLQREHEANIARKAFDEAMAAARAQFKPIKKNRRVGFKAKKEGAADTSYRHEDLASVAEMVDPILAGHGLSYKWRTSSEVGQPIIVTCIVSHRLGHREENTLTAGRDETGNKNPIQSIGSTITYLQRYTLKAALGLAVAADDDAQSAGDPPRGFVSEEQVMQLRELAESVGADMEKLLAFLKVADLAEIYADKYDDVVKVIKRKGTK